MEPLRAIFDKLMAAANRAYPSNNPVSAAGAGGPVANNAGGVGVGNNQGGGAGNNVEGWVGNNVEGGVGNNLGIAARGGFQAGGGGVFSST